VEEYNFIVADENITHKKKILERQNKNIVETVKKINNLLSKLFQETTCGEICTGLEIAVCGKSEILIDNKGLVFQYKNDKGYERYLTLEDYVENYNLNELDQIIAKLPKVIHEVEVEAMIDINRQKKLIEKIKKIEEIL
jgi:hypothetical protein